jgi:hypothetical protein
MPLIQKPVPAPLNAESVFCGGDDWHTLICQVGGTPSAKYAQPTHTSISKQNNYKNK